MPLPMTLMIGDVAYRLEAAALDRDLCPHVAAGAYNRIIALRGLARAGLIPEDRAYEAAQEVGRVAYSFRPIEQEIPFTDRRRYPRADVRDFDGTRLRGPGELLPC